MANATLLERLLDSKGVDFSAGRSVLIAFNSCIGWLVFCHHWTALLGQYLEIVDSFGSTEESKSFERGLLQ